MTNSEALPHISNKATSISYMTCLIKSTLVWTLHLRVSPSSSSSLCPDTEETAANEAAGGGNKAVHWQPEGRGAKPRTILADADAELSRQKKEPDQVKKQTEGGTETVRLTGREMWNKGGQRESGGKEGGC